MVSNEKFAQNAAGLAGVDRWIFLISEHWMLLFSFSYGVWVLLPFLAPVLMEAGWQTPGKVIYAVYTLFCHQLPQRSFFLFGPEFTYSLTEIGNAWKPTTNPGVLREFLGSAELGWKVAWSDRMVSMYSSVLLASWVWWPLRDRIKQLSLKGLFFFLLPMGLDGVTHMISDLQGLGEGFRYHNQWLAEMTGYIFKPGFYAGTTWGTFNSGMRLLTGILFGVGFVWYLFPLLDDAFQDLKTSTLQGK